eukprot:2068575-Amphidinium_carterae.1
MAVGMKNSCQQQLEQWHVVIVNYMLDTSLLRCDSFGPRLKAFIEVVPPNEGSPALNLLEIWLVSCPADMDKMSWREPIVPQMLCCCDFRSCGQWAEVCIIEVARLGLRH